MAAVRVLLGLVHQGDGEIGHGDLAACGLVAALGVGAGARLVGELRGGGEEGPGQGAAGLAVEVEDLGEGEGLGLVLLGEPGGVHQTGAVGREQGAGAAEQVARGVDFFSRTRGADVVVVTRGGGSMEDLWPFNEEVVARAVAACSVPVISAVGHEIDFTICDFAADLRVPTPSAAAELVIGRRQEMSDRLNRFEKDLHNTLNLALTRLKSRLDRAAGSFVFKEPVHLARMRRQQLDELENRLQGSAERWLLANRARLDQLAGTLTTLNPSRQLERGYAILFDPAAGKPVTTSKVAAGTRLQARLADGEMTVEVQ